ncbi:MAG: OsmC family protein [Bacteroidales bacterium]
MKIYFGENKQVFADIKGFTIKTDQAVENGGQGLNPDPFTYFLASMGTCAGIYVKSFCMQRGIPTENITLSQENHWDSARKIMGKIEITIHVPSDFPEKYEPAVIQAASLCTVKRHIREDIELNIKVLRS